MFDDAAQVLEEIEPEEKSRNEVLGARVNLYMAPENMTLPRRLPGTLWRSSLKMRSGGRNWPMR
jgi:hypothetical protein